MSTIYEVTGYLPGFFGAFSKSSTLLVWDKYPVTAGRVAQAVWTRGLAPGGVRPMREISVVPAREQLCNAYGARITDVINIPMDVVHQAWDAANVPAAARTQRPKYITLP